MHCARVYIGLLGISEANGDAVADVSRIRFETTGLESRRGDPIKFRERSGPNPGCYNLARTASTVGMNNGQCLGHNLNSFK